MAILTRCSGESMFSLLRQAQDGRLVMAPVVARRPCLSSIDVQVCFWNLRGLLEFQTAFLTVAANEA